MAGGVLCERKFTSSKIGKPQLIAELCRREGIAESLYYSWSKEFLEAGKRRFAGDTARAATSNEVKDLRRVGFVSVCCQVPSVSGHRRLNGR
jgi:transposase-like protein